MKNAVANESLVVVIHINDLNSPVSLFSRPSLSRVVLNSIFRASERISCDYLEALTEGGVCGSQ